MKIAQIKAETKAKQELIVKISKYLQKLITQRLQEKGIYNKQLEETLYQFFYPSVVETIQNLRGITLKKPREGKVFVFLQLKNLEKVKFSSFCNFPRRI
jgi:hypothetical protein